MRANICERIHHADTHAHAVTRPHACVRVFVFNHINDNYPSWISRLFVECIKLSVEEQARVFSGFVFFGNVDGCVFLVGDGFGVFLQHFVGPADDTLTDVCGFVCVCV